MNQNKIMISNIRDSEITVYSRPLEQVITGRTIGHFKRLFMMMLQVST